VSDRIPRQEVEMGRVIPLIAAAALFTAAPATAQEKGPTAVGKGGAASSVDPLATQAAIDVLAGGGNAFDAAVAAAAVLGVVEPYSCGIGGGGFMLVRDGDSGRITSIDSRERAPAAMKPDSFFIDGKPPTDAQFSVNRYSGLSAGVPGTPAAWEYLLKHYGTLSLRQALSYGVRVATDGFVVDKTFYDQTAGNQAYFDDIPSSAAIYLDADGSPRDVGTRIKNPDMAKLYRRVGREGAKDGFYTGPVADAIVKAVTTPPTGPASDHNWRPGLMTAQDLANYRVKRREPLKLTYFGADIYGMGPPSSGGSTVLETLNIIQDFERRGVPYNGRVELLYRYLEASRLAYADRNAYIGDPSFVNNPIAGMLSNEYAATRAALIGPKAATGPVPAGQPPANPAPPAGSAASVDRSGSTTHLSVADKDGNIVAYTFTIESTGGNGIVVPGYGFLLNNELTDFDTASVTAPNRAAGNKRPRSSIAPTIVTKGAEPWFTIGSPGGATIITTVGQTLINRINSRMPLEVALGQPRASQRNSATTEAESAFVNSREGNLLLTYWGERYRAPAGDEIGALTGIEFLSGNRFKAVAEPNRRGGGSAKVVTPAAGPNP
jgi:gamma-glutamyltranspeptidase/glutathione hydrolase